MLCGKATTQQPSSAILTHRAQALYHTESLPLLKSACQHPCLGAPRAGFCTSTLLPEQLLSSHLCLHGPSSVAALLKAWNLSTLYCYTSFSRWRMGSELNVLALLSLFVFARDLVVFFTHAFLFDPQKLKVYMVMRPWLLFLLLPSPAPRSAPPPSNPHPPAIVTFSTAQPLICCLNKSPQPGR